VKFNAIRFLSGPVVPFFQRECSMALFDNLLEFFGLYTMKKVEDERNQVENDEFSPGAEFCQICQYPISRCICGRYKGGGQ
jgi:hypothetical protein